MRWGRNVTFESTTENFLKLITNAVKGTNNHNRGRMRLLYDVALTLAVGSISQ